MSRTPEPGLDLRPLDADGSDPARLRFVAAVMERVGVTPPESVEPPDFLWGIWSMAGRLSAAAAVLVLILSALSVWERRAGGAAPATVADALGIPPEFTGGAGGSR